MDRVLSTASSGVSALASGDRFSRQGGSRHRNTNGRSGGKEGGANDTESYVEKAVSESKGLNRKVCLSNSIFPLMCPLCCLLRTESNFTPNMGRNHDETGTFYMAEPISNWVHRHKCTSAFLLTCVILRCYLCPCMYFL